MPACSSYALSCPSRCCDSFGDCPEYSGRPCATYYHFDGADSTASWWDFQDNSYWIIIYVSGGLLLAMALIIIVGVYCRRKGNPQNSYDLKIDRPFTPTASDIARLHEIRNFQSKLGHATSGAINIPQTTPLLPPVIVPPAPMQMAFHGPTYPPTTIARPGLLPGYPAALTAMAVTPLGHRNLVATEVAQPMAMTSSNMYFEKV